MYVTKEMTMERRPKVVIHWTATMVVSYGVVKSETHNTAQITCSAKTRKHCHKKYKCSN